MMAAPEKREAEEQRTERKPPKRSSEIPEVPKGTPAEGYPQRLSCATAAQLLDVSYSWLRKQTMLGLCPAVVRHGHRVTYDKTKLLGWNHEDGR